MILQKSPDIALFGLIIYLFYKYLKRKKSAERILASELAKANQTLGEMKKITYVLQKISRSLEKGVKGDHNPDRETSLFEEEIELNKEDLEPIELRSIS